MFVDQRDPNKTNMMTVIEVILEAELENKVIDNEDKSLIEEALVKLRSEQFDFDILPLWVRQLTPGDREAVWWAKCLL